jgi:BASS family bile acid:Na+ symporter
MGTLPLWVLAGTKLFAGHGEIVMMSTRSTLVELALALALPLVVGMALKAKKPALAGKLERGMMILTGVLLVLVIALSVAKSAANVGTFVKMVGIPVLTLQCVGMAMSYFFAQVAGLPEEQRITVALEGGIQNATLAFALGMALTNDVTVTIPAIVYSIAIYFTAAVFIPLGRARVPIAPATAAS